MKKEFILPLFILLLSFLFIVINIFVFFTQGNAWFVKKKLKIGVIILSLTGFIGCGSPMPSCYDTAPLKEFNDSIANTKKQDSIKQQLIEASKAMNEEMRLEDSILNAHHKQFPKDTIPIRMCYKPSSNDLIKINKKNQ